MPVRAAADLVSACLDARVEHAGRKHQRVRAGAESDLVEEVVETGDRTAGGRIPGRDDGAAVRSAESGIELEAPRLPARSRPHRRPLLVAIEPLARAAERTLGRTGRDGPEEELLGARTPASSVGRPFEVISEAAV